MPKAFNFMDLFSIILIVAGLCLFEVVSSIDNAIINAEVLSKMQAWARRWFLVWGMFFNQITSKSHISIFRHRC